MPEVCRSCRASIIWATTENGRWIPLDPDPSDAGNMRLVAGRAVVVPETQRPDCAGELYVSHFATCPNAKNHRSTSPTTPRRSS